MGYVFTNAGELYMQVDKYKQTGPANPAGTLPGLAGQNLFSGVSATSVAVGYSFAFR